ncbi:MAG: proline dehydrogenase, partial [Polyangiaceae bacterium]
MSVSTEVIRHLVLAAKKVADDPFIVNPLVQSTGLSRQGVELALREYLETDASDAEIETLIAQAKPTSHVHVILSANVFTGALRAIACARAAAPKVSVQLSSRDPVFAR